MKFPGFLADSKHPAASPPVWGAWVEILAEPQDHIAV